MLQRFLLFLIGLNFVLLHNLFAIDSLSTIAVLDFRNNSLFQKAEYESLSKGLAEILITELSQVNEIQLVERQQLNAIIQEMQLSQTGLISENASLEVGKLVGAKYLVLGSFMSVPGRKIRLDARIVEVETGRTLLGEKAQGKDKEILKLINKLSRAILGRLDVRIARKSLERVKNTSPKAIMALSKGLEFEDAGNSGMALKWYQVALKEDKNLEVARKRLEFLQD